MEDPRVVVLSQVRRRVKRMVSVREVEANQECRKAGGTGE